MPGEDHFLSDPRCIIVTARPATTISAPVRGNNPEGAAVVVAGNGVGTGARAAEIRAL